MNNRNSTRKWTSHDCTMRCFIILYIVLSMFCAILTLIAFIVEALPLQAFCSGNLPMYFIECHIQMLIMLHIVMKRANKCPPSNHIQLCGGLPCINLKDKTSIMLCNMYNLLGLFPKPGFKLQVSNIGEKRCCPHYP